jgi:hypothetical protein
MLATEGAKTMKFSDYISIAALIVSVIGWIAVHQLTKSREQKARRLMHLQEQIGQFYGPLLGLIQQINTIWEIRERLLKRIDGEDNADKERALKDVQRYYYEHFFSPLHDQIITLLQSKSYLIDGDKPQSFDTYLKHGIHEKCVYTFLKDRDRSGDYFPAEKWPREFREDVNKTHEKLLKEIHKITAYQ